MYRSCVTLKTRNAWIPFFFIFQLFNVDEWTTGETANTHIHTDPANRKLFPLKSPQHTVVVIVVKNGRGKWRKTTPMLGFFCTGRIRVIYYCFMGKKELQLCLWWFVTLDFFSISIDPCEVLLVSRVFGCICMLEMHEIQSVASIVWMPNEWEHLFEFFTNAGLFFLS